MVDHPTNLYEHRGMAAQKAKDIRRLRSRVSRPTATRQADLEDLLAAAPCRFGRCGREGPSSAWYLCAERRRMTRADENIDSVMGTSIICWTIRHRAEAGGRSAYEVPRDPRESCACEGLSPPLGLLARRQGSLDVLKMTTRARCACRRIVGSRRGADCHVAALRFFSSCALTRAPVSSTTGCARPRAMACTRRSMRHVGRAGEQGAGRRGRSSALALQRRILSQAERHRVRCRARVPSHRPARDLSGFACTPPWIEARPWDAAESPVSSMAHWRAARTRCRAP